MGISPCKLDGVKFIVGVMNFAGGIGHEDRRDDVWVGRICAVRLNAGNVVGGQKLVYSLGFIGSEWPGFDLVGLFNGLVVELRCAWLRKAMQPNPTR